LREDGTIGLLSDGSVALHPASGTCGECCVEGACYRCGTHDVARSSPAYGSDKWSCKNPSSGDYANCRSDPDSVHRSDKVCFQSSSAKSITAGNWDASDKHVTQSGRFSTYSWQSGDRLLVTAGTGVILGWYDVVGKVDADSIEIDGDLTEDLEYPFSHGMWYDFGKQLGDLSFPYVFADYSYKAGDKCKITSGTDVIPGIYDVDAKETDTTIRLIQSIGSDSFDGDIVGKVLQKVDVTDDSIVGTIYRASTGWSVCSCEGKSYYIAYPGSFGPTNTSAELIAEDIAQGQWRRYSKDASPYEELECCCGTEYLLGRDTWGPGVYLEYNFGWRVNLEVSDGWCHDRDPSGPGDCDGIAECVCIDWGEYSSEDDPVVVYVDRFDIYVPYFTIEYSSCSCQFEVKRVARHYVYYDHPDDVEYETLYFSAAGVIANEGVIEFTIPCPWYPEIVNDVLQDKLEDVDCSPPCDRCETDSASGSIAVKFTVNILMVDDNCDEFVESPE
jgi:hypothetical protein